MEFAHGGNGITVPLPPQENLAWKVVGPASWSAASTSTPTNNDNFDLTEHARQKVRCSNPPCGPYAHAANKLHEHVERAVHAHSRLHRDQHYLESTAIPEPPSSSR